MGGHHCGHLYIQGVDDNPSCGKLKVMRSAGNPEGWQRTGCIFASYQNRHLPGRPAFWCPSGCDFFQMYMIYYIYYCSKIGRGSFWTSSTCSFTQHVLSSLRTSSRFNRKRDGTLLPSHAMISGRWAIRRCRHATKRPSTRRRSRSQCTCGSN